MSKHLLIVESPTKARTISKFLPKEYSVIASIGHVRDLPRTATEIPQKYKQEPWARLGIDVHNGFAPLFINIKGKSKIMSEIKKELKEADSLILATDEDREGESIAWHLKEMLKPKIPVKRMVFHEITKSAILESLENYRDIDDNLVKAQETRRILDRLFGYKLSELIWKKITYKMSAGRVQSPGLRLLVERERDRYLFKKANYNDIIATLIFNEESFQAKLTNWNGKKIATGANFNNQGELVKDVLQLDDVQSQHIIDTITGKHFTITDIEQKPQKISPPAPFITSTLQQESNRRLRLTSKDTMRTAQSLYEQGYITYMRTDSYALSGQALNAARTYISQHYAQEFLPEKPNFYGRKKSKGAQEAHEAIRPAGASFAHPDSLHLIGREKDLYALIWRRTIASQMSPAIKESTTITFQVPDISDNASDIGIFTATGSIVSFQGYLAFYSYSKVDDKLLPQGMNIHTNINTTELTIDAHETKPPSRYNDASLVKKLEELGIGRPSTYASIINTLLDRGYTNRVDQALVPTLTGFSVIQFLEKNFPEYVDYEFTSLLEDTLDKISTGEQQSTAYLSDFYFGNKTDIGLEKKIEQGADIDANESQRIRMPELDEKYEIRVGRYGPFVIINNPAPEEKENFSIPEDCQPSELKEAFILELAEIKRRGPESIGVHPDTDEKIYCLTGRFGPYVQQGEITEENPKPKRASIPRHIKPQDITLEIALKLLSIPREIGIYTENNEPIIAAVGRFGAYIKCGTITRSLKKDDDVYTIGMDRAVELLQQEPTGKRRKSSSIIKEIGEYNKKKIIIYKGPYGLYLKFGTKNIKLPDEFKEQSAAESLSLEQAKTIIKAQT